MGVNTAYFGSVSHLTAGLLRRAGASDAAQSSSAASDAQQIQDATLEQAALLVQALQKPYDLGGLSAIQAKLRQTPCLWPPDAG